MTRGRNTILIAATSLLVVGGLLAGPVATWLQAREAWLPTDTSPDALYLVAGARDQPRRVAAMADLLRELAARNDGSAATDTSNKAQDNIPAAINERTNIRTHEPTFNSLLFTVHFLHSGPPSSPWLASFLSRPLPRILIGNDTMRGRWSREAQRNLTLTEWAEHRLNKALASLDRANMPTEIVPGQFTGTDGEMEALGLFLRNRPEIKSVALVSSPFHMRRLLRRLSRYAEPGLKVYVAPSEGCGRERNPFWVGSELIKMARDRVGLARAPMLSRGAMSDATVYWLWALGAVVAVLAYAWLGYPLLLRLAVARKETKTEILQEEFSTAENAESTEKNESVERKTAVLIAAHNEADHIRARIDNLLALNRPPDSIWIGVDGSDDGTAEAAREAGGECAFVRSCVREEGEEKHVESGALNTGVGNYETRESTRKMRVFEQKPTKVTKEKVNHGDTETRRDHVRSCAGALVRWCKRLISTLSRSAAVFFRTRTHRTKDQGLRTKDYGPRTRDYARQPRLHILDFPERHGKAATLKTLVAACAADPNPPDTLVFTDANTRFEPDALDRLLAPFADPGVGGVCGRLILTDANGAAAGETAYWNWESRLKHWESRLDSCLGANGAIYAVRHALFWQALPDNTIVEDFVIGMKVRQTGHRMVYEPNAVAEEPAPEPGAEWTRRVRIGTGDWQTLRLCAGCLHPKHGLWAWMFFSHKVLRWCTPHFLLLLGLAAARLVKHGCRMDTTGFANPIWLATGIFAVGGLGLLAAVMLARAPQARLSRTRIVKTLGHFTLMQMALFVGFLKFCRGNLKGAWPRTPR